MMKSKILLLLLGSILCATTVWAQTGKIAGQVKDKESGEPLPGANIIIAGTTLGAAANMDGYYSIINVPPGTYNLRSSFIGYQQMTIQEVRVNINLTTTIDFGTNRIAYHHAITDADDRHVITLMKVSISA